MKKRSYKLSLPRWALAQRESWYAELAARGLRVQKAGAMLTRFAPAPPARLRYRFEVGSDEGSLPAGQKEFYEECGWQYVLNDRPLHLFCAPEQTDAPDLHTDPAALADSLKTLRGSILSQALGTALWALLMFAQLTYLAGIRLSWFWQTPPRRWFGGDAVPAGLGRLQHAGADAHPPHAARGRDAPARPGLAAGGTGPPRRLRAAGRGVCRLPGCEPAGAGAL